MYGITETTVHVTYRPITRARSRGRRGQRDRRSRSPICGSCCWTRRARRCRSACPGRCTSAAPASPAATSNRPELTAERFVPDPFAADAGAQLYRSGDLARRLDERRPGVPGPHRRPGQDPRLPDRARRDRSRARRASPASATRRARARGRAGRQAARRLCRRPGRRAPSSELRSAPQDAAARVHGARPLRAPRPRSRSPPTARLDRKALPEPDPEALTAGTPYVAPRTPTEETIAEIWADALGVAGPASTTTSSTSAATR